MKPILIKLPAVRHIEQAIQLLKVVRHIKFIKQVIQLLRLKVVARIRLIRQVIRQLIILIERAIQLRPVASRQFERAIRPFAWAVKQLIVGVNGLLVFQRLGIQLFL